MFTNACITAVLMAFYTVLSFRWVDSKYIFRKVLFILNLCLYLSYRYLKQRHYENYSIQNNNKQHENITN